MSDINQLALDFKTLYIQKRAEKKEMISIALKSSIKMLHIDEFVKTTGFNEVS